MAYMRRGAFARSLSVRQRARTLRGSQRWGSGFPRAGDGVTRYFLVKQGRMIHVMLNPDGSSPLGLLVIVEAATGVVYHHQCGGLATYERAAEGYLVPVGSAADAQLLADWFWQTFQGNCYQGRADWTPPRVAELRQRVGEIACWYRVGEDDLRANLTLDETRLDECVEAWISVQTPLGRGILVLENSD